MTRCPDKLSARYAALRNISIKRGDTALRLSVLLGGALRCSAPAAKREAEEEWGRSA
jgi:hypothetical protein